MLGRPILVAALSMISLITAGCSSTLSTFHCEINNDCQSDQGSGGTCEANSFCSFSDMGCGPDGRRYSDDSGELSNQCVNGTEADAGAVDSGVADAQRPIVVVDATIPADGGSGSRSFRQDTDSYTSTVDTTISMEDPDVSFGTDDNLECRQDSEYALLRFDDIFGSGVQQIPLGASISQATLTLVVFDTTTMATSLLESAVDWDESTTFNTYGLAPGVQVVDMHAGVIADLPGAGGAHVLDVTTSVSRWASNERPNFGWILVSNDGNDHRLRSSESQSKPVLVVDYFFP